MSTRAFGLLAGLALLAAGLALPATGQAVKPTAKLEFEVPDEGRVGFNHLVFKAKKKKKALPRSAAKRLKRGSKKLGKGVRAKVDLKNAQGVDEDVQVVARVARIKGEKKVFALDVAVLHPGPGARTVAEGAGAPPGSATVRLRAFDEAPATANPLSMFELRVLEQDEDVTDADPGRGAACSADGELAGYARNIAVVLSGELIIKRDAPDAVSMAGFFFCDIPSPGQYDYLFDLLDLDRPQVENFNCTGVRIGDNTPFGHTFTGGTCNQPIVDIRFEITKPAGGTYFDFSAPFPSCAFANGQRQVHCTSPASSNKMKIQGSAFGTSQPTECVRVTARNQTGQQFQAVTDTSAFATCP